MSSDDKVNRDEAHQVSDELTVKQQESIDKEVNLHLLFDINQTYDLNVIHLILSTSDLREDSTCREET